LGEFLAGGKSGGVNIPKDILKRNDNKADTYRMTQKNQFCDVRRDKLFVQYQRYLIKRILGLQKRTKVYLKKKKGTTWKAIRGILSVYWKRNERKEYKIKRI